MSSFTKSLFASLTIALIIGAQLFGMGVGFICECSNDAVITTAAHCHPDGQPCQSEDDAANTPVTHHEPNRSDLEASTLAKTPSAPAPLIAFLSTDEIDFVIVRPPAISPTLSVQADTASPPLSNAQLVTHCMVLLV